MNSPCYCCKDRFYDSETQKTCHQTCDKYAQYKEILDAKHKIQAENKSYNEYKYMVKNKIVKIYHVNEWRVKNFGE